jgi:leucyl aminopeptidase
MPALSLSAQNIVDNAKASSQCAILPLFKDTRLTPEAREIDLACNGAIKNALKLGDFAGKRGQSLLLPGTGRLKRILLLGCGERNKFDRDAVRGLGSNLYSAFNSINATQATLHTLSLGLKKSDHLWALGYLARHLNVANYRYSETVSKPKKDISLRKLIVNTGDKLSISAANKALRTGRLTAIGINDAKELANLPGNLCTPGYLANHARKLSRKHKKLSVSIVEEAKMRELGMNALLSVSAGSDQPAKLIVMQYRGAKSSEAPQVLVGKGITFDSGGISLKPGAKMDEMKYDMGGAASVFGTLRSVVELDLPLNVIGIVAAAENMPSGSATKPGDVITSMAGKTIEVLNTDAEGRLVLCDALTYAKRYKPAAIVDIATLTGACVVALGSHATGLFANNDKLAEQLLAAGTESHDRAWRMPLWQEYQKQLDSNFADIANIGGPGGGSITAACFLSRFTEDQTWAHLDIAGSAWDSVPKGATGRPVAMLLRYLMDQAGL